MQKKEPIKKRNFFKKCPNKNFLQQNKSLKELYGEITILQAELFLIFFKENPGITENYKNQIV